MTLQAIESAVLAGDHTTIGPLTEQALAKGASPAQILNDALTPGMRKVGDLYEQGEVFLPEMLIAAEAMEAAVEILRPLLTATGYQPQGRVVFGTVAGDLHDIGKRLVCMMLEGQGFEVVDLGVDVAPSKFADAVAETGAKLLGVSALLTTTLPALKEAIELVRQRCPDTRIMVGGAPLTSAYAEQLGADGYAPDAPGAATLASKLIQDKAGAGLVT